MISNRDELVAKVDRWLVNSTLTVEIPDLIAIAEGTLRRRLKVIGNEVLATVAPGDVAMALPSDFRGLIDISIPGSHRPPLEQVTIQNLRARPSCSGPTSIYAIGDNSLYFWPTAPSSIQIDYHRSLPPLTTGQPVNWLLTEAPDLYLFATLCEGDAYGMNDTRLPLWEKKRDDIIADINKDSAERKYSRGPLVCRRMPERC